MISFAIALQLAAPTVVPRTLTSETMDGYELVCTVAESTWKTHRVNLTQTGGRAFLAHRDGAKPTIDRTHIELLVTMDENGKINGMTGGKLIENPGYGYGTTFVEIGGNNGRAIIKVSEVSAEQFAITIVHTKDGDRSAYAGFCDVKVIPQSPLTDAETREYIRNPYGLPGR